jgi:hypothetical protein
MRIRGEARRAACVRYKAQQGHALYKVVIYKFVIVHFVIEDKEKEKKLKKAEE